MKHITLLCALLSSLFFSSRSYSFNNFKGQVISTATNLTIQLESGSQKRLFSSTPELMDDIQRLHVGDILHFQGSSDEESINVTIIEYIELQNLQGHWQSEDWDIFNFNDDQLQILSNPLNSKDNGKNYSFSIFPGKGEFWTILLSNQTENKVGQLKVSAKKTKIEIFNFESKDTQEHFDLIRIH